MWTNYLRVLTCADPGVGEGVTGVSIFLARIKTFLLFQS